MEYQEAKAKADEYAERTGHAALVYQDEKGDFRWGTDWHYRHGCLQWVKPEQVRYHTQDGEYDD